MENAMTNGKKINRAHESDNQATVEESSVGTAVAPTVGRIGHDGSFDEFGDAVIEQADKLKLAEKEMVATLLARKQIMSDQMRQIDDRLRQFGHEVDDDPVKPRARTAKLKASSAGREVSHPSPTMKGAVKRGSRVNKTQTIYNILMEHGGTGKTAKGLAIKEMTKIAKREFNFTPTDVSQSIQALRRSRPPKADRRPNERGGKYFAIVVDE